MKRVSIILILFLANCSGGGNNPPTSPYPGRLAPNSGWTDYGSGAGAGYTGRLSNPFAFPDQTSGKSVNYVYTQPQELAIGKTITLDYTIGGNPSFGVVDKNDVPPATMRLFIWGTNSDTNNDRWWCPAFVNLAIGRHTLSCVINGDWTGVFGQAGSSGSQFAASLTHPFAMGFTFGGQYFAGHGVWVLAGNGDFTINGYTVQ